MNLKPHITVNVCENNNHGNPSGKCVRISFDDDLNFETIDMHGVPFKAITGKESSLFGMAAVRKIKFGEETFKYISSNTWAGNMMWNAYYLPAEEAVPLLNYLLRNKEWRLADAPRELETAAKAGEITVERYLEIMAA